MHSLSLVLALSLRLKIFFHTRDEIFDGSTDPPSSPRGWLAAAVHIDRARIREVRVSRVRWVGAFGRKAKERRGCTFVPVLVYTLSTDTFRLHRYLFFFLSLFSSFSAPHSRPSRIHAGVYVKISMYDRTGENIENHFSTASTDRFAQTLSGKTYRRSLFLSLALSRDKNP